MKIASAIAALVLVALFVFPQGLRAQEARKYQPLSGTELRALNQAKPPASVRAGATREGYCKIAPTELQTLLERERPALLELRAGQFTFPAMDWEWVLLIIILILVLVPVGTLIAIALL